MNSNMPPAERAVGANLVVYRRRTATVETPRLVRNAWGRQDVAESLLYAQLVADTYSDIFEDSRQWFENHSQYLDDAGWEYVRGGAKWDRPPGDLAVDEVVRDRFRKMPDAAPELCALVERALGKMQRLACARHPAVSGFGVPASRSGKACFYILHVDECADGAIFHMVNFWYVSQETVTDGLFHTIRSRDTLVSTSYGIRRLQWRDYESNRNRIRQRVGDSAQRELDNIEI